MSDLAAESWAVASAELTLQLKSRFAPLYFNMERQPLVTLTALVDGQAQSAPPIDRCSVNHRICRHRFRPPLACGASSSKATCFHLCARRS